MKVTVPKRAGIGTRITLSEEQALASPDGVARFLVELMTQINGQYCRNGSAEVFLSVPQLGELVADNGPVRVKLELASSVANRLSPFARPSLLLPLISRIDRHSPFISQVRDQSPKSNSPIL